MQVDYPLQLDSNKHASRTGSLRGPKSGFPLSGRKETAKHNSPHGPPHPNHYAAYIRNSARLNKRKNHLLVIDRRRITRRRQRSFEHMPTGIFPVRKSGLRPLQFCFRVVAPHRFRPALTLVTLLCAQCLMTSPALHESSVSESTSEPTRNSF